MINFKVVVKIRDYAIETKDLHKYYSGSYLCSKYVVRVFNSRTTIDKNGG